MEKGQFASVPEPGDRYNLLDCVSIGIYGKTYIAMDSQVKNKKVYIKIQQIDPKTEKYLASEYKLLRDFSSHQNILDFYGVYRKKQDLWFVLEFCEGMTALRLVNELLDKNRRMSEEHIAYIINDTVKAIGYLHGNHIIHRDIKASNILLTRNGEIKLTGFSSCICVDDTLSKTGTALGSPCWMAPETIEAKTGEDSSYGNRCDVWSLGITAIELGEGKAPYQNMHPTRILFQVARNPPPTLYRKCNWSEDYNDFINECLVKNPEYRPYMAELLEHPFLTQIPENNYHLSLEIKSILNEMETNIACPSNDPYILGNCLNTGLGVTEQRMYVEDLAALEDISEKSVLSELRSRFDDGKYETFVGDILLTMNANKDEEIDNEEIHSKYEMKSKSENQPHIYAVADGAFQHALHHIMPQKIILTGESGSGKTRNYLNLMDHLLFLGRNTNINVTRIKNGIFLIHTFIHASTPFNNHSTRCIFRTDLSYGNSGKITGASFKVNLLEKFRVSSVEMTQGNFDVFYYLYDGLKSEGSLEKYCMNPDRQYRYLRVVDNEKTERPRNSIVKNIKEYTKLREAFKEFEFQEEQEETIFNIFSAILNLGEIRFQEGVEDSARIINESSAKTVAKLLDIHPGKFCWALTSYCYLRDGVAEQKKHTCDEARDTRDVLANTLFIRLVDYVVCYINHQLELGKTLFGEKYVIRLLDYFGFECFKKNELSQLLINTFNEQIQHHYIQRTFNWEMVDLQEEEIEYKPIAFYDNKFILEELLGKSVGIFTVIDQASKLNYSGKYISDYVFNQEKKHIRTLKQMTFAVAHYTGTAYYNTKEMPDKNRDFLPPEIIQTLRLSNNPMIKLMFTQKLNKTGNMKIKFYANTAPKNRLAYLASIKKDPDGLRYSQSKKIRTAISLFKATSLDILSDLSVGSGSGGIHFVRCIKTNLDRHPGSFNTELIKQQLRSMSIVQTAKAKKFGYPHRISFPEFLRRYEFLAFDFDENVDLSKDNCRLLLVRLKMEGWAIGKSKIFMKYYNEEYLARLYESQVKKIIKIQSILRRFLAKCRLQKETKEKKESYVDVLKQDGEISMTDEKAAIIIQKAYRRHVENDLSIDSKDNVMDSEKLEFIRPFALKWKKNSVFHVLMQYKSVRFQDVFSFSQQVHFYNQKLYHNSLELKNVDIKSIDNNIQEASWNAEKKPVIMKINFQLQEVPYYDTSCMCASSSNLRILYENDESWDKPYQWRKHLLPLSESPETNEEHLNNMNLINLPYNRNPDEELKPLKSIKYTPQKVIPEETVDTNKPSNISQQKEIFIQKHKTVEDLIINADNTKPANEDFDYIKSPVLRKTKPSVDPIAELKTIGRKNSVSDDNPPFNFQGMLRKTNFKRDSVKHVIEGARRFSLKESDPRSMLNGNEEKDKVSLELVPGLILQGMSFDL